MNGAGASSDHQPSAEHPKNGWTLPCHFQSLILMNCKSRAEAFARSLHYKLRTLSQTSGNYGDTYSAENAENSSADADGASTSKFSHDIENHSYNERSHLMTSSKDIHRAQHETNSETTNFRLTSYNEDELCHDLGFYSPESPNEIHLQLLSPKEPDMRNSYENINLTPRLNPLQCFNNEDIEESGCISSVSSVLTEQDNTDDDEDDHSFDTSNNFIESVTINLQTPITSQPRRLLSLSEDLNCVLENDPSVPTFLETFWAANNLGFMVPSKTDREDVVETNETDTFTHENTPTVDNIEPLEEIQTSQTDYESNDFDVLIESNVTEATSNAADEDYEHDNYEVKSSNEINGGFDGDEHFITDQESDANLQEIFVAQKHNELTSAQSLDKLNVQLSLYSDDEVSPEPHEESSPIKVRRSSSLKTVKTPPGTPNRKKIVRFADSMGLDLEDVKTVFLGDLPVVPNSAYKDLEVNACQDNGMIDNSGDSSFMCGQQNLFLNFVRPKTTLVPVFLQPGSLPDFYDRLRKQSVCLESAVVTGISTVRLVIRVLNLDFHKTVIVRYTSNDWRAFQDVVAEYVNNSNDVFSDKFYTVFNSSHIEVGERLCFAINYKTQGKQFWDNNGGQNYIFHCFPEHDQHPTPSDDSWIHFN